MQQKHKTSHQIRLEAENQNKVLSKVGNNLLTVLMLGAVIFITYALAVDLSDSKQPGALLISMLISLLVSMLISLVLLLIIAETRHRKSKLTKEALREKKIQKEITRIKILMEQASITALALKRINQP